MFGITRGFKYILPVVNSARIHIGYDELNRKANYTKNISPSIPIITFRPSIPSGQFSSIASPPTRQDPEEQSKSPNDILYHTHRLNLNDLDIELSRKGIIRHGRNKQMEIKEKLKGITCKKFWRGMQIWRSPSLEVICSKLERNIRYYIIYQTIYKIISREIKHLGNGLSKLKEDLIFTKEKTQAKWTNKFYVPTYSSETRIHKFKQDLLKFFPFATFLTVPMMELLLPLWLVIFPNSIPSHFQSERARKETIQHRIRHRRLAVQDFILHLLIFMSQLEHEKYIPLKDREEITGLKLSLEDGIIATGILQHKNIFSNYINLNTVPVPILTSLVQFLCLEPITGLGVINRIRLKLGKTAIPFDAVYVHWYMKPLLKKALKRYISRIRQRDKMLSLEGINFRTEEELKIICFKRGIETENKSRDQLSSDLRIWLNISNFSNVSNFLLIFTGILDFLADTNQQELRSTAEDFHLMDAEKYVYKRNLKLFEREMDINTIEKIVKKIEARKQVFRIKYTYV